MVAGRADDLLHRRLKLDFRRVRAEPDATPEVVFDDAYRAFLAPDGSGILFRKGGFKLSSDQGFYWAPFDSRGRPGERKKILGGLDSLGRLSPDRRLLAYGDGLSGRREAFLTTFPAVDQTIQLSANGGGTPQWNAAGKAVDYLAGGSLIEVQIGLDASGRLTASPERKLRARQDGTAPRRLEHGSRRQGLPLPGSRSRPTTARRSSSFATVSSARKRRRGCHDPLRRNPPRSLRDPCALGAGGMGEVYRARDTKLDREVAIKVLPESLAKNPDALARFEREAHAVAALNHPNILSIHDFGSEGGVAFAVTELLVGETLRARLDEGALAQRRSRRDRDPDREGARGRAREGDRPPRPEAGERLPDLRRPRQDPRLRPREGRIGLRVGRERARRRPPAPSREPSWAPSATCRPNRFAGGTSTSGPTFRVRRDSVRDARRETSVQGRLRRRDDERDPEGRSSGAARIGAQHLPRARPDRAPLHGEEPRVPLPLRRRRRVRSRRDFTNASSSSARVVTGRAGSTAPLALAARIAGAAALLLLAYLAGRRFGAQLRRGGWVALSTADVRRNARRSLRSLPTASSSCSSGGRERSSTSSCSGSAGRTPSISRAASGFDNTEPAFSPDGAHVAFRSERDGGGIYVMGATGESVHRVADGGFAPSWSPDGRRSSTRPSINRTRTTSERRATS